MYSLQKSKTFVLCQDIFLEILSVKLKKHKNIVIHVSTLLYKTSVNLQSMEIQLDA